MVLLATATFIAYLQPPGGLDDDLKHVLVANVTSCSAPSAELLAGGMSVFRQCSLLWFFVFDGLSFGLSVGSLVLVVMLSMPRIQWNDPEAEAVRFYILLVLTWALLWLCCICGFRPDGAWAVLDGGRPWSGVAAGGCSLFHTQVQRPQPRLGCCLGCQAFLQTRFDASKAATDGY